MLAESNARIENTIRGIQEAKADKEKTKKLRQSLSTFREEVEAMGETKPTDKRVNEEKEITSAIRSSKAPKSAPTFQAGDAVRLKGQTSPGTIMEVDGKKATVAFG